MDTRGRSLGWLRGLGTFEWQSDERPYAALLEALTRDRLETEFRGDEMTATARTDMGDIRESQAETARSELDDARENIGTFRTALEDARARGGPDGRAEVPYDSASPNEDVHADALIQYLVRPGYAEVRTEDLAPGHYRYHIRVDWERLRALAEEQGHPLPR